MEISEDSMKGACKWMRWSMQETVHLLTDVPQKEEAKLAGGGDRQGRAPLQ